MRNLFNFITKMGFFRNITIPSCYGPWIRYVDCGTLNVEIYLEENIRHVVNFKFGIYIWKSKKKFESSGDVFLKLFVVSRSKFESHITSIRNFVLKMPNWKKLWFLSWTNFSIIAQFANFISILDHSG